MDAAWAQVIVGLLQTGLIGWGLYLMQQASSQRNQQLDDQHAALMELLRRSEPQP